jgi:MFS superfamily sulfate permease-like transporter
MFTNADVVREQVRDLVTDSDPRPTVVVLDGRTSPSIDVTAAGMLVLLRQDLSRLGATLVMADDVGQVRDVLTVAEPDDEPPMYVTIEEAIAAASTSRDETGRVVPRRSEAD